jgi:hypothetical protein
MRKRPDEARNVDLRRLVLLVKRGASSRSAIWAGTKVFSPVPLFLNKNNRIVRSLGQLNVSHAAFTP